MRSTSPPSKIDLRLDASDAPRQLLRSRFELAVVPGRLELVYPKWIPGEHGPTGPIGRLAGLRISTEGRELRWRRDPLDLFAFLVVIPDGMANVVVELEYQLPLASPSFAAGASTTTLAVLSWNAVILLPRGADPAEWIVTPTLTLPATWSAASALGIARADGGELLFEPTSVARLIDSPVLAGAHLRKIDLPAGGVPHRLAITAESPGALAVPTDLAPRLEALIDEAGALFGSRPYSSYHWLLSLSDHVSPFGLEHGESSDNRLPEATFRKDSLRRELGGLLAHEYVHAWNGFARRPAGLAEADYQQPLDGSLLWTYEGLTQWLGFLLAVRSGLWTMDYLRATLAWLAARLDAHRGRRWRPLLDTAVSAQVLYEMGPEGQCRRRGTDFYDEGVLLWLEVDAMLHDLTGGRESLDRFCRRFFGQGAAADDTREYDQDDVFSALDEIAPFDWAGHFTPRLEEATECAPIAGLSACGWQLGYHDAPNAAVDDRRERFGIWDWTWSLGLQTDRDGTVRDVVPGLPADEAGLAPRMQIRAIDGLDWSPERLDGAIRRAAADRSPIEIGRIHAGQHRSVMISYHEGVRLPVLVRDPKVADRLPEILRPRREARTLRRRPRKRSAFRT